MNAQQRRAKAFHDLTEERDRYKAALERIASGLKGTLPVTALVKEIALNALSKQAENMEPK